MTARKWPNLAQDRNATSSRCDGVLMGEQTMPRSWALFARACLPLVVVLVLVGGLLTIAYGVRAGGTQIAVRSCDPAVVMNHRLDELGRRGFTWTIKPDPIDEAQHSAVTSFDDPQVTISTKVTCALMTTVVNHEWDARPSETGHPGEHRASIRRAR